MKTFAEGELLTAQDVNNELNPATAPNIAYAMAVGTDTITCSGTSVTSKVVQLPAGRFSSPPQIFLVKTTGGEWADVVDLRVTARSTTSFTFTAHPRVTASASLPMAWFAVQMQSSSAVG